MRSRLSPRLKSFLYLLITLRLAVFCLEAFGPILLPDIWRQVLCLGVSMRYWSRWALEPAAHHLLLPAILDAGDAQGVMPMELPILYLVTAPLFALGPFLGRAFAIIACDLLAFGASLANARAWRGKRILGIDAEFAMLLLPIFSISVTWSGKYMPDYLSMVLTCLALGLSWKEERPVASFLAATLGLLLKPASLIVLAILAVNERVRGRRILSVARWAVPAVLVALLYYTLGMRYLAGYQDLPTAVGVQARSPLTGAAQFFRNLRFVSKFYLNEAFFTGGILLILGTTAWNRFRHGERIPWPLWLLTLFQFFALSVLDGGILFYDHPYYLMVLAPVLCTLFVDAVARSRSSLVHAVFLLGLVLPLVENSARELKPLWARSAPVAWSFDRQARELRDRNPTVPWHRGARFRSSTEQFANLGLYFGEIQGSGTAPYGFFYSDQTLPEGCTRIDGTAGLVLAACAPRSPAAVDDPVAPRGIQSFGR